MLHGPRSFLQAERYVAEGEQHLLWQEELFAELDRDGQDTEEAKVILDGGALLCTLRCGLVACGDHARRESCSSNGQNERQQKQAARGAGADRISAAVPTRTCRRGPNRSAVRGWNGHAVQAGPLPSVTPKPDTR